MIGIVKSCNDPLISHLVEQMFSLRRKQFLDRRKWKISARGGLEIDHFDRLDPVYVMVTDGGNNLFGALRLLKTVGPHMLSHVFPEILGGMAAPRHSHILECSRFCVDTEMSREFGINGINRVTQELLYGLFCYAREQDIRQLVAVHDLFIDRILRRAGCDFKRIGKVITCDDGLKACASMFDVSSEVIDRLYLPGFEFRSAVKLPLFVGAAEPIHMVQR